VTGLNFLYAQFKAPAMATPGDVEIRKKYGLHPEGQAEACQELSNQVSNNRHRAPLALA
jgi:hypothetical protein